MKQHQLFQDKPNRLEARDLKKVLTRINKFMTLPLQSFGLFKISEFFKLCQAFIHYTWEHTFHMWSFTNFKGKNQCSFSDSKKWIGVRNKEGKINSPPLPHPDPIKLHPWQYVRGLLASCLDI